MADRQTGSRRPPPPMQESTSRGPTKLTVLHLPPLVIGYAASQDSMGSPDAGEGRAIHTATLTLSSPQTPLPGQKSEVEPQRSARRHNFSTRHDLHYRKFLTDGSMIGEQNLSTNLQIGASENMGQVTSPLFDCDARDNEGNIDARAACLMTSPELQAAGSAHCKRMQQLKRNSPFAGSPQAAQVDEDDANAASERAYPECTSSPKAKSENEAFEDDGIEYEEDDALAASQSKLLQRIANPVARAFWVEHYRRVRQFKANVKLEEEERREAALAQQQEGGDPLARAIGKPRGAQGPLTLRTELRSMVADPSAPPRNPWSSRSVPPAEHMGAAFGSAPLRGLTRASGHVLPAPPLLPRANSCRPTFKPAPSPTVLTLRRHSFVSPPGPRSLRRESNHAADEDCGGLAPAPRLPLRNTSFKVAPKLPSPATVTLHCDTFVPYSTSASYGSWLEWDDEESVDSDDSDYLALPADGSPLFKIYDPVGPNRRSSWLEQVRKHRE
eukprot:5871288-Pleurochrysis_carterae.AAC.1